MTHDARVAATGDRLLSMRDGRIVDDTVLNSGASRREIAAQLLGWEA